MKKTSLIFCCLLLTTTLLWAQDEDKKEKKGFKKENLFTGGAISLGLGFNSYGNSLSVGASPVLGYNITNWLDAGIVVNYTYTSYKYDDGSLRYKVRQSDYGGGVFTRIYPLPFLYFQAQFEHNFTNQKVIEVSGSSSIYKYEAGNSLLVGAGYAGNRDPLFKKPFFYIAIMADVSGNRNSPYVSSSGAAVPLIWTGLQIPIFQGRRENGY